MASPPGKVPNTYYISLIKVDPALPTPLYRQIYFGLREVIQNGRLAPSTKLPSTRDLALIWGVSRNTLRNAFDQLIAEGYLEAIVGRGTFVAGSGKRPFSPTSPTTTKRLRPISALGKAVEPLGRSLRHPTVSNSNPFALGEPDLHAFPFKIWRRILNRCQRRRQQQPTANICVNGIWPLREAIASYLVSARGVRCQPEQIDIVPGSVSGMYLAALALLNPGERVWIEDPGYINAGGIMRYRSADLIPVAVDEQGLDVQQGIARAPDARMVYVTPSHQYPLGVTMSQERRLQLLAWAGQQGAWILEDDYDSEFRYDGLPLQSLQGLDTEQRVIYCGTFSKVMLPSLRLGYMVLPPDLMDVYTGVKVPLSLYSPSLIQEAVAEFMLEGHFIRHIRRMRKHYQQRRDALVAAFERHLAGAIVLGTAHCGIHTVGYLTAVLDETAVLRKARQAGMSIMPLSGYYLGSHKKQGIVIGFANVAPEQIDSYIARLAAAIL